MKARHIGQRLAARKLQSQGKRAECGRGREIIKQKQ
jgi:hypothetical protein